MKDVNSRAIVFVMVIIAIIVVANDIKKQGLREEQASLLQVQDVENPNLAISEVEDE
ncbi:MAG: hypothetical protein AAF688_12620 [Bacteroidota bacterium]